MAVCPNGHDSATDDICDACGARIASSTARVVGKHHAGGPRPSGSPEGTCPWCGNPSAGQFCAHCGFRVRRPFAPLGAPVSPSAPDQPLPEPAPEPEPEPASERPAFLDWFTPTDPSAQIKPPARHEPPTKPTPSAQPEPVGEPGPADAAESYSWSAYAVSPALPFTDPAPPLPPADIVPPPPPSAAVPPTAPMPKYTPTTWTAVVTSDQAYYEQMQQKRGSNVEFPVINAERRFQLAGKQMRIGRRSAARGVEPEIDLSVPPVDPGISRLHALLLPAADGSWAVLDPGSANGTLLNGREIEPGDLIPLRDGDRINLGAWTAITLRRE